VTVSAHVPRRMLMAALLLSPGAAVAQLNFESSGGERSVPPNDGRDPAALDQMRRKLSLEYPSIRSVVVLRHGRLAFEFYREGLSATTLHDARFATASVVSTLVGIALQKGHIKSVKQPLWDFFPNAFGVGVDPRATTITLEHVLTLTAGFDPAVKQIGRWAFPLDFALQRRLVSDPGAAFSFNPGTAHIAARVLVRTTGRSMSSFAREHLFRPLQIERFLWRIDGPGGGELGYSGLQLTARDMAKLGQLYLQGGVWSGKALMSSAYAEAATRQQSSGGAPLNLGYGYLWWVASTGSPSPEFIAGADDGQRIYADRTLGVVAVLTSDSSQGQARSKGQVDAVLNNLVLRAFRK